MFRYVAAVWNPDCNDQSATAERLTIELRRASPDWHVLFSVPGVRVLCAGVRAGSTQATVLPDGCGILLGTVFDRLDAEGNAPAKASFGRMEVRELVQSDGRALIERYWGRYVAVLVDQPRRSCFVIRSPTGELDCLESVIGGVSVYSSAAEHLTIARGLGESVNWGFVAAHLATTLPETRQTGLSDVSRVLHGECVAFRDAEGMRRQYWHPARFVGQDLIEDPAVAAEMLRRTTRACVHAWASCYDGILGMLSGGLDSSIVMCLLADAPSKPRLACLNYRNPYDKVTDERRYAKNISDHIACPLLECEQDATFSLRGLVDLPRMVDPSLTIFEIRDAAFSAQVARDHGAGAYFLGHGGDQLLFQFGAQYVCGDYVHAHGLRPSLLAVALDAARIGGGAWWSTLMQGVRDGLRRDTLSSVLGQFEFSPFLTPDAAALVKRERLYIPNWFDEAKRMPSGKCWQIFGLSLHDDLYSPAAAEGDPEYVFPLLSQPLQELVLRIPSYVLTFGARDRGLARVAFQADVPQENLRRRGKAFVDDFSKEILITNRSFVRELLLDGHLVREGIVARDKIERALSGDFGKGLGHSIDLLDCATTEAWSQTWAEPASIAA